MNSAEGAIDMANKLNIVQKLVIGITAVSGVTYATSAFFLLVLKDWQTIMPDSLFILMTLALGIFWTGFLGFVAARWFVKPLLELTKAAREAANGNLQVEVTITQSDDEMQALNRAFTEMIKQLRTMITNVADHSHATDAYAGELRGAIEQATNHIMSMTEEANLISEKTERQSDSADHLFDSVRTMTEVAKEIAVEAQETRKITRTMSESVHSGETVIKSLIEGMQRLAELNRDSYNIVAELNEHAAKIGSITNVVAEFAEQTNLLALNASIEAARAGEEGRGFGVVAQAVKALAEQSGSAVKDIRKLIERIQSQAELAAERMSEQRALTEREAENGEISASALRVVTEEVARVNERVEAISQQLVQQGEQVELALREAQAMAAATTTIRNGAQAVFEAGQQQTAVMEEISATSESLRASSAELRKQVGVFVVKGAKR